MIYAAILAGGKGTRMQNSQLPKQFLKLGSKPIIIHTIEKFILNEKINKILVLIPEEWVSNIKDIIKKHIIDDAKIDIVLGGNTRNETLMKGIQHIEKVYGINNEDIIVTHDAVRPFVSYRIIEENINYAIKYGATDTVISSVDTIVISEDNEFIKDIPNRNHMYQGQTPQSFNVKLLLKTYEYLSDEQKVSLTDAAKIMVLNNIPVKLIEGEYYNIKITTQYDLLLANAILKGFKENDK